MPETSDIDSLVRLPGSASPYTNSVASSRNPSPSLSWCSPSSSSTSLGLHLASIPLVPQPDPIDYLTTPEPVAFKDGAQALLQFRRGTSPVHLVSVRQILQGMEVVPLLLDHLGLAQSDARAAAHAAQVENICRMCDHLLRTHGIAKELIATRAQEPYVLIEPWCSRAMSVGNMIVDRFEMELTEAVFTLCERIFLGEPRCSNAAHACLLELEPAIPMAVQGLLDLCRKVFAAVDLEDDSDNFSADHFFRQLGGMFDQDNDFTLPDLVDPRLDPVN